MAPSSSHSGYSPGICGGWNSYDTSIPNMAPPMHSTPTELAVFNGDSFGLLNNSSSRYASLASIPTSSPGHNLPFLGPWLSWEELALPCMEASMDGTSSCSHSPSNTQMPPTNQSVVPGRAPTRSNFIDSFRETWARETRTSQSPSKPQRRRAATRPDAQGKRVNKLQPVAGRFQCKWENCPNTDGFSRKGELQRHVNTIHLSPRSFECPKPECDWAFNRKDNLSQHLGRVHGEN